MQDSKKLTSASKVTKPPSATVIAADKIKHLIFTGELASGSNHLESELAERLGMSRTPVREATLTLQAQGLLEVQPRKGVKIKSISLDDTFSLFEVLSELECLAVKRAALMGYTKSELNGLFEADKTMRSALKEDDRATWQIWDEKFHLELVRLSKNKYLEMMVESINDQVRRVRSVTLNMRPLPTKSNQEHRQVSQAILKGDADKALETHRIHCQRSAEIIIDVLKKSGLTRI